MYYSNQCVKVTGGGKEWNVALDAGVVNRAQPISALISAKWIPYWHRFLSGRLSGHSTQIRALFCLCGSSFVLVECCRWPITGQDDWALASVCRCLCEFSLWSSPTVLELPWPAAMYFCSVHLWVEVNRELQKHLLRQHKHSHTHPREHNWASDVVYLPCVVCASASRVFCEVSFIRQVSLSFECNLSLWHFVSARVSAKCRVLFLTLIYILNAIPLIQSHAQ